MEPFTWTVALDLLMKYGPNAVALATKIVDNIKAGKANEEVTEADRAELVRLSNLTGAEIYARSGITLPPTPNA